MLPRQRAKNLHERIESMISLSNFTDCIMLYIILILNSILGLISFLAFNRYNQNN